MNVAMRLLEKKKELPKKEKFLKKSLLEAQKNLTDAYAGLDSVQEPDLIDSYIYQLNAAYLRYRVLLRDVKALTSDEVHQTPHIDSEIHIPTFDLETRALSDLDQILFNSCRIHGQVVAFHNSPFCQ